MSELKDMSRDRVPGGGLIHYDNEAASQVVVRGYAGISKPVPFQHVKKYRLIAGGGSQQRAINACT